MFFWKFSLNPPEKLLHLSSECLLQEHSGKKTIICYRSSLTNSWKELYYTVRAWTSLQSKDQSKVGRPLSKQIFNHSHSSWNKQLVWIKMSSSCSFLGFSQSTSLATLNMWNALSVSHFECHLTALINTIIPHVLQKRGGTLCWEERDTVTIT